MPDLFPFALVLLTNVWQIAGPGWIALLRRLATLPLGVCAGVALGSGWLAGQTQAGSAWPRAALGAALFVYAALGLLARRPRVGATHEA
jgi:hypothetical protein